MPDNVVLGADLDAYQYGFRSDETYVFKSRKGLDHEIVDEIQKGEFDLLVLGIPLPQEDGRLAISGLMQDIMYNTGNCSVLIVRSNHTSYPIWHDSSERVFA